jgi:hypothetical protein
MSTPENEKLLVAWFKEKFATRTPPRSILDMIPEYRVTWTEIREKMAELGWNEAPPDLRLAWEAIHQRHRLRPWWKKLVREREGA